MPRSARRWFTAAALALVLAVAGAVVPAVGALADTAVPQPVAPEEGAFLVPGPVVLEWAGAEAPAGYEVQWSAGELVADGSRSTVGTPSLTIDVEGGASYSWQVRVLPDGAWSDVATFHVEIELPTLPLPEEPAVAAPQSGARPGAVPGAVWIVGALGFSAVLLAAVFVQSRTRRERDA